MQTQIKPSSFRSASFIPAALAAVLTLALAPATRAHPSADSRIYAPTAKPFGKSYATWSAQWWKWALARPVEGHPFIEPGFDCNSAHNGQSGRVRSGGCLRLEEIASRREYGQCGFAIPASSYGNFTFESGPATVRLRAAWRTRTKPRRSRPQLSARTAHRPGDCVEW